MYLHCDDEKYRTMQANLLPMPAGANFNTDLTYFWQMMPSEQIALIYLLQHLRPKVSIEIGTAGGGSLQVLSHFSEKVYSLDINAEVPECLAGKHPNVEYILGDSTHTFPALLKRLELEDAEVGFILIDGDHNTDGVRRDITAVLNYKPKVPLYVFMHDSFIIQCRLGIYTAKWAECPYVHALELDYVPGGFFLYGSWGPAAGLALACFSPQPREGELRITSAYAPMYQQMLESFLGNKRINVYKCR